MKVRLEKVSPLGSKTIQMHKNFSKKKVISVYAWRYEMEYFGLAAARNIMYKPRIKKLCRCAGPNHYFSKALQLVILLDVYH